MIPNYTSCSSPSFIYTQRFLNSKLHAALHHHPLWNFPHLLSVTEKTGLVFWLLSCQHTICVIIHYPSICWFLLLAGCSARYWEALVSEEEYCCLFFLILISSCFLKLQVQVERDVLKDAK